MRPTRIRTLAVAAATAATLLLAGGGTVAVQAEFHDFKKPRPKSEKILAEFHDFKRR